MNHTDISTAPPGYVLLGPGSRLEQGDMCWNLSLNRWKDIDWAYGRSISEWPTIPFARKIPGPVPEKEWINPWE